MGNNSAEAANPEGTGSPLHPSAEPAPGCSAAFGQGCEVWFLPPDRLGWPPFL
jgi:hypothetical protein